MTGIIDIQGLTKSYREPVLDGLDLSIDGGVFALLGPNGAGKTTLVSILSTLLLPDAGVAAICGFDVARRPREVRRLTSVTGQETSLDELLTGRENLTMLARLLGLGSRARARADQLLEQFDLQAAGSRKVGTYSGGMRRRLDLAASLIRRPAVLFLDEPTTGLDPVSRTRVWDDIRSLAASGTTVFLTTQTLDEAEALADRIVVLHRGRIVADGSAAQLTALVGGQRLVVLDVAGQVMRSIDTDGSAEALARCLATLNIDELGLQVELRAPSLDDAFVALTVDHERGAA